MFFQTDKTNDDATQDMNDLDVDEAKERIHNLLDDAFSFVQSYQQKHRSPREKVEENVEQADAGLQQTAPEPRPLEPQYPGKLYSIAAESVLPLIKKGDLEGDFYLLVYVMRNSERLIILALLWLFFAPP